MQVTSKMQRKRSAVARRAWNVLRLALLWAREKVAFSRTGTWSIFVCFLNILKISAILMTTATVSVPGYYIIGNVSFLWMTLLLFTLRCIALLPCVSRCQISPASNLKSILTLTLTMIMTYERDDEMYPDNNDGDAPRKNFLNTEDEYVSSEVSEEITCDEAIDMKAEEFIAKFYEQIKLQRQISYLQCHGTLAN
ncbi:hypothetical protein FXO38_13804 [Capsicum annuum]|nr:hypothetical protein FXO38_13804 [Capsicum annuum]KAF3681861.1 hypothetical protein FXO37_02672 [Capsicum annuum]